MDTQGSSSYDYGYGLGGMVTAGILGLQLLPRNAIKGDVFSWCYF